MTDVERLKAKAAEIAEREGRKLLDRTPASESLHQRAVRSLPNGVASNFQAGRPLPDLPAARARARRSGTSTATSTSTSTAGSA